MLIVDREFIERWCSEYDRRASGTQDQIEEAAILSWVSVQGQPGFLNKEYFIRLGRWKTPRYAATRETNNEYDIIERTRSAYLAKTDLEKLNILKRLKGVGVAVASTILYYLQPDRFAIFDYHVRNTLKKAGKLSKGEGDDNDKVWLEYTQIIRAQSSLYNKTIREVEKALFAYDKWGCGGEKLEGKGVEMGKDNDEVELKVYLPPEKMRQLEAVAQEYNQAPAILASIWIIDRLQQLRPGPGVTRDKPPSQPEVMGSQEQIKNSLAQQYLSGPNDRNEKCLFLKARQYKQWGNHIAGFYLTRIEHKEEFTQKDIRNVLKCKLVPQHYGRKGCKENELLTADVRVNAPAENPGGFPCLERVRYGVYRFIGFTEGIKRRYGEEALKKKLLNCEEK